MEIELFGSVFCVTKQQNWGHSNKKRTEEKANVRHHPKYNLPVIKIHKQRC